MAIFSKRFALASFATAVMAGSIYAAPEVTFNGNIDYRVRGQIDLTLNEKGEYYESKTLNAFSNHYAWNLGMGAVVNENLTLKFRVSNPKGSNLETVTKSTSVDNIISIPQAEIQYKKSFFGLSAGLIEVDNSTTLNLVRAAEDSLYLKKIDISNNWSTYYNNSVAGLKVSFDAGKMIDVNVVAAIAEFSGQTDPAKAKDYTDLRMITDVPVSFGENNKFTVTPAFAVRSGLTGKYDHRKMNTNGGVDFSGKLTDAFSLKAGLAYGQFWNADAVTSTDWKAPSALLLSVIPSYKFGIHSVSVGYSFGQSKDREATAGNEYSMLTNHTDIRWGFGVAKGFTIMPRYRMWMTSDTKEGTVGPVANVTHRPELIFTAKF